MKRQYLSLLLLLAVLGILNGCAKSEPEPLPVDQTSVITETAEASTTVPTETEPPEERFRLTFAGDCTLGSNPKNTFAGFGFLKTVGEDFDYPFRNVIEYFENDEASFVNLEGPLTDVGNPAAKKHSFRGPSAYVNILTQSSVECVSLANNHTLDYGQTGYESTLETLNGAGIPYVERDASVVFTTESGLTIGVYGAVYYLLDTDAITAGIAALKAQGCDLVIFAPHWGHEGSYRPTAKQEELGHAAIDAGADIVWGSHPHVLQPVEEYGGGVIFYSMGNFVFGGNGYPGDYDSALIQQEVIRDGDGVRLGARTIVPVNVSSVEGRNNFQPTPYAVDSGEYSRVLSKLDGRFSGPNLKIG